MFAELGGPINHQLLLACLISFVSLLLGYMRPLAIWAMQYALQQARVPAARTPIPVVIPVKATVQDDASTLVDA